MSKYIVFDISNILYRTFFANKDVDADTSAGLAHHSALMTLQKYFREHKPHKVIMAFDRASWRKKYTADENVCISRKPYKGNRRQGMTPSERQRYDRFLEHLNSFEELMRIHTSVVCLYEEGLEADDLIAGFVQQYSTDEIIIISADKDLVQLLRHPNVGLIDPSTGKDRRHDEKVWNKDAEYFIFEKCIRGDAGDNVQSAFPRVRSTRIKKAYDDAFELVNLMNERWTHIDGREFLVKDLYEENKLLMDLELQPECVRNKINETIEREMTNPGKFSYFHVMKFLGKYQLKKIAESIDQFAGMLSR
jgi:5'-3' exonuclease